MSEAAFLAAIRDDPDDDLPRLAYADWFEEHGQADRGEFIRVQVELSHGARDRGRRVELLRRLRALSQLHRAAWLGPLKHWAKDSFFDRGFITQASMDAGEFLDHAAKVLAVHPITRLRIVGTTDRFAELIASPHVEGMKSLDFLGQAILDQGATALAGAHRLARLRVLHLRRMGIGPGGVRALVASPRLAELTDLNLAENGFGDSGIRELASAFALPRLARLDLSSNNLGAASADLLATCSRLQSLRTLRLAYNRLTPGNIELLARSPHLQQLQVLDVIGNGLRGDQSTALRREFGGRVVL